MKMNKLENISAAHYDLLLLADPNKQLIETYLPRSFAFECCLRDELVGIVVLLPTRPETLEIVNLAVLQSHQGQGIGEALVQFAITYAKQQYIKTIEIGTGSTSFGQLYLYQKCGFRLISIDRDFFLRHYDEEIIENKLVLKDMVRLRIDL